MVDYTFEVVFGSLDIHSNGFLLYILITHNDHDICWTSELINECCEFLVLDYHTLKWEVCLNATQLELLYDIADLLKSVNIFMLLSIIIGYNQEGWPFKQHNFVCVDSLTELFQVFL